MPSMFSHLMRAKVIEEPTHESRCLVDSSPTGSYHEMCDSSEKDASVFQLQVPSGTISSLRCQSIFFWIGVEALVCHVTLLRLRNGASVSQGFVPD